MLDRQGSVRCFGSICGLDSHDLAEVARRSGPARHGRGRTGRRCPGRLRPRPRGAPVILVPGVLATAESQVRIGLAAGGASLEELVSEGPEIPLLAGKIQGISSILASDI